MNSANRTVYEMLNELNALIKDNEIENGEFSFDELKAKVAIDFAIEEIRKTIKNNDKRD